MTETPGSLAPRTQLFYCALFVLVADVSTNEAEERPLALMDMVRSAAFGLGTLFGGALQQLGRRDDEARAQAVGEPTSEWWDREAEQGRGRHDRSRLLEIHAHHPGWHRRGRAAGRARADVVDGKGAHQGEPGPAHDGRRAMAVASGRRTVMTLKLGRPPACGDCRRGVRC